MPRSRTSSAGAAKGANSKPPRVADRNPETTHRTAAAAKGSQTDSINENPASPETHEKLDVYTRITNRIVADLENGVRPWMKPWTGDSTAPKIVRPLRHNGVPYSGINIMLLWMESADRGYTSPTWISFKQALELGGNVRKGEKGALVVYANEFTKKETNEQGEEEEHTIPFLKGYTVFNTDQVDGLPAQYYPKPEPVSPEQQASRIEQADRFFEKTGARIRHGGEHAFYSPQTDHIQMPSFERFRDAESHAAVLAHELTHWTRHKSRLDRDLGRKQMGDEGYAREELVAELGSAFLCADLAINPEVEVREDHAAYIAQWLTLLQNDKRAIFSAAAHAQRAAEYLHGLQQGREATSAVSVAEEPSLELPAPELPPQEPLDVPGEAPGVVANMIARKRAAGSHVERLRNEESLTLDLDFGVGR